MLKETFFRRRVLLGLAGACTLTAGFVWERRTRPRVHTLSESFGPPRMLPLVFPEEFGTRKVFLDAGHGAPNNPGNSSCFCQDEQDFTLDVANNVAKALRQTNHFDVRLSREGDKRVTYQDRVDTAATWGADAFVSIHSDIRGQTGETQSVGSKQTCRVNLGAPGFSVLLSEDGNEALVQARKTLARSTARRMHEAGFGAYAGTEYGTLYAKDPDTLGVFYDRHAYEQRIFVLWKPTMPSIIVETHHALDPREVKLWSQSSTHQAFASALALSLVDTLAMRR